MLPRSDGDGCIYHIKSMPFDIVQVLAGVDAGNRLSVSRSLYRLKLTRGENRDGRLTAFAPTTMAPYCESQLGAHNAVCNLP
jgi:hypothetical protein